MTDDRPDDRNLSSPVPLGPSSEAGATSGTGASAPAPVVPVSNDDETAPAGPARPAGPTGVEPASDLADQSSHRQG